MVDNKYIEELQDTIKDSPIFVQALGGKYEDGFKEGLYYAIMKIHGSKCEHEWTFKDFNLYLRINSI